MTPVLQHVLFGAAAWAALSTSCSALLDDTTSRWSSAILGPLSPFILLAVFVGVILATIAGIVYSLNPHVWWFARELRRHADEDGVTELRHIDVRDVRVVLGGIRMQYRHKGTSLLGWVDWDHSLMAARLPPFWDDRARIVAGAREIAEQKETR